jgi:Tol biopolymer transport system component
VRKDASDGVWVLRDEAATEVWTAANARLLGAPAISPDGRQLAFSVRRGGGTSLYVVNADGTSAQVVTSALTLLGTPTWAPNGRAISSAVIDDGRPTLFDIPLDGTPPRPLVREHSQDAAWSPDGRFVVYTGADVGTRFTARAALPGGGEYPLPRVQLTRGARHIRFAGSDALVFLRGEIDHKDLWTIDLTTGIERRLTNLPVDFTLRDFDLSPDGQELILEQEEERADIVAIDLESR